MRNRARFSLSLAKIPNGFYVLVVGLLLTSGGNVCAQSNLATPSSSPASDSARQVYLKFINAATGGAVQPASLVIDGKPAKFQVEAASLVALTVPDGEHTLVITAEGFNPMEVVINVSANTPPMTFELDPAEAATPAPVPEGKAAIEGHITDADTGELLEQVKVTLPDAQLSTTTTVSGHFEFEVAVPPANDNARPAVTLEVRAEDYVPVRLKNMALVPGERRRMPISLERVTSETETLDIREIDDAGEGSGRNFEWMFDVTIR